MFGIDSSYGFVQPLVEGPDCIAAGVARFVHKVVSCDPRVMAVAARQDLPEVHHPVLKVLVRPERGPVGRVVAVPVLVLGTGQSMEVDDAVQAVAGCTLDRTVEQFEPLLLHLERRHVVFEMAIVERQPHAVEAK